VVARIPESLVALHKSFILHVRFRKALGVALLVGCALLADLSMSSSSARTSPNFRAATYSRGGARTFRSPQSIHAGDGRISGHRAESLYSGSGILWVRNYFLRKRDFQVR